MGTSDSAKVVAKLPDCAAPKRASNGVARSRPDRQVKTSKTPIRNFRSLKEVARLPGLAGSSENGVKCGSTQARYGRLLGLEDDKSAGVVNGASRFAKNCAHAVRK